jgi:hypothetical protein
MKTFNILIVCFIAFAMTSCNTGVKKDLNSGLKITNNGLSYGETYLTLDGQKTTDTEFPLNTNIFQIVNGISGFVDKDNFVFLGASITVYDKNNKEVVNYPDLFAGYDSTGVTPEQAEVVTLSLKTGNPMIAGESYTWKSRIWDKKGKGEINSEIEITVKEKK